MRLKCFISSSFIAFRLHPSTWKFPRPVWLLHYVEWFPGGGGQRTRSRSVDREAPKNELPVRRYQGKKERTLTQTSQTLKCECPTLKAKNGIHNFDTLWTCGLVVKIVKINCAAFSINGLEWNARDALGKEYLAENPRISNRQTPPKKPSLRTTRRRGVVDWLVGILSFMCISLSLSLSLYYRCFISFNQSKHIIKWISLSLSIIVVLITFTFGTNLCFQGGSTTLAGLWSDPFAVLTFEVMILSQRPTVALSRCRAHGECRV